MFQKKKPVISFEIFPPKKEGDINTIYNTIEELASLQPDFISVTYGAGGTGSNKTIDIASFIKKQYHIESLAHLTCITSNQETIDRNIQELKKNNIDNVLALRGDIPEGFTQNKESKYTYAKDLIKELKSKGDFSIGAAIYPEGHIECDSMKEDLIHVKEKVEAGASFLVSQLFFHNELFYRFWEEFQKQDINCKVSAGIMPILSKKQIEKMIFMCGASLPAKVIKLLGKYENKPEDLKKQGIEYAAQQVEDLIAQGVDGVHVYTMNRPEIAKGIVERL